ncbi:MAG: hypothetical protein QM753_20590 [Thermomicrobiales bacterium]
MCTEPSVPDMSYSVLYEGKSQLMVPFGTGIDVAAAGIPLNPGMWTIQETPRAGLDAPFAFCVIYDANGASRLTVSETVQGGSLNILLAADEKVNCEWYSVATVPQVTGDPNALPIDGLLLDGFSCPYGTSPTSPLASLLATCIEKGVAAVTYTASRDGVAVSTQVGATDDPRVDFQSGLDTRLMSGPWTVSATLPPEYSKTAIFCSIITEDGTTTDLPAETSISSVGLELHLGDTGFCNWFNIESQPRSGPSRGIVLLVRTCPDGFDRVFGDYQTCTLPLQEPISFDFIHNGQVVETGTASAPDTQLTVKSNGGRPDAGEWTIRPSAKPNMTEPGWFCWGVNGAGELVYDIEFFAPPDGGTGVSARFGPDLQLQCDVWLYAGNLTGTVQTSLFTCPEGFDASNPAAGDRHTSCSRSPGLSVEYVVDGVSVRRDSTSFRGESFFPGQPGQWQIKVGPEAGAGVTFATCDHTRAALNQRQTIEPTINSDRRSITLDLNEGDTLICEFFLGPMMAPADTVTGTEVATEPGETEVNPDATTTPTPASGTFGGGSTKPGNAGDAAVPTTGTGGDTAGSTGDGSTSALSIQHYDCGIPIINLTLDELVETCSASLDPSAWTMNEEPFAIGDGYAEWPNLEAGTVTVSNAATEGKDDTASAVYCSIATIDGIPLVGMEVPVKNGAIDLVFDQAAVVYCAWFVAP